jgi:iron-chelate-transporting ATPase
VTARESTGGLRAEELCCSFGAMPVLHGASFDVQQGCVTALVGPNGSGKSTLLRSMARLHRPDAGDVCFDDGASALLLSAKAFARAMEVTGISTMADRGVDELSGGERQRVWLATCLCQQTSVLLLDEPTTYLDLRYQVEILDLIRDLADHHGVAVGVVLHDLQQAGDVADCVVLLDQGHVVATGPPCEVLVAEQLSRTFGIRIDVHADPVTGGLRIQPVGSHTLRVRQPA